MEVLLQALGNECRVRHDGNFRERVLGVETTGNEPRRVADGDFTVRFDAVSWFGARRIFVVILVKLEL